MSARPQVWATPSLGHAGTCSALHQRSRAPDAGPWGEVLSSVEGGV